MGPLERFEAYGLSVVRSEDDEVGPVMESWRTVRRGPRRRGPAARALMARMLGFDAAISRLCDVVLEERIKPSTQLRARQ